MQRRTRTVLSITTVIAVGVIAFGLYWFQPWKLWVDERVNDALPAVALAPPGSTTAVSPSVRSPQAATAGAATDHPTATLVSRGTFISHEHSTMGVASVVRNPDGTRQLAIAHLRTSNGPDVHVWLSDGKVTPGGWHVFDDGAHVDLGGLKGNIGNQVYSIPASADLTTLTSVSIWCVRFDVSFGAAQLDAA